MITTLRKRDERLTGVLVKKRDGPVAETARAFVKELATARLAAAAWAVPDGPMPDCN